MALQENRHFRRIYAGGPLIIRHVTVHDSHAWQRLREALWPGDQHAAEIAAFFTGSLAEPTAVLVAEALSNSIVAVVELSLRSDLPGTHGARTGYIEGLYVVPQHRNTGLTQRLLQAAKQWAREQHCTRFASDREDRLIFCNSYRSFGPNG
ncbi:MAG: GNAT family N-acetyltransferase [Gammaproteobacteria bacterium]|nr:GNAT family N-acetyltransferase [Gammaproteobacteria bacterium]